MTVTWDTKCAVCGVDEADCAVCWYAREVEFACEAHELPDQMLTGFAAMLTDDHGTLRGEVHSGHAHDAHCQVTDVEWLAAMYADAAELIASYRGTNNGPTRPRVVAWLNDHPLAT